jgi:hypothetical protein
MGEGVDPTQMCQSLVDRVAQSKQLTAITNPEILVLFEDWLEELEHEVVAFAASRSNLIAEDLVAELGLSARGATFLVSKLKREGRLP